VNFLDFDSFDGDQIKEILEMAKKEDANLLRGKGVALIFEKPSLRTRNSAEMATVALGGHPVYIQAAEVGIDVRESAEDIARTLIGYHSVIAARVFDHRVLQRMARSISDLGSSVPVINLLSDKAHPCQAVADLLTITDLFDSKFNRELLRIAYVGDSNNVALSLAQAALKIGASISIASPDGYDFDEQTKRSLIELGPITFYDDPIDAVSGSHVVYGDTWVSMGDEARAQEIRAAFEPRFKVDGAMMAKADSDAVYMHCLPAHRGEEVTNEVMERYAKVIFKQAANRMAAFKGVLSMTLSR
ncbi:unnamed protein product, partial [Acidithrix sp. C25]